MHKLITGENEGKIPEIRGRRRIQKFDTKVLNGTKQSDSKSVVQQIYNYHDNIRRRISPEYLKDFSVSSRQ